MATPSGEIYLLRNVPLTPAYEHTIDFADKDEQFSYFSGFIKNLIPNEAYSYIRREREYIAVELPLKELDDVNYMLFRSADSERLYYAFITDKRYVNDVSSYIYFEIDVLQTFAFDYKWQASYIKQAHVDRWTAEHKPIYSKTDEGLDYGTEYSVESAYRIEQSEYTRWLLVSVKDYSAIADEGYISKGGTVNPAPSPFACFLVPLVTKLNGSAPYKIVLDMKDGSFSEIVDYNALIELMNVSSFGDYIQGISVLTYNPFVEAEIFEAPFITTRLSSDINWQFTTIKGSSGGFYKFIVIQSAQMQQLQGGRSLAKTDWNTGLEGSLPTAEQWEEIKAKPYTTKRDKRFESKLLCAPYRYNLLTDWRTSPVIFKNEYMTTDEIDVRFSFALSYNAPFRFWLKDYKKDVEGRNTCLSQPLALEFPVISDAYYSYMLQNKNTIQANLTNSLISAGTGIVSGAIAGAGVGGIGGAAYGAITAGVSGALNVQAQIRSENAKQLDLKAKPDTVINSTDSSFNILDNNAAINFYRMRICCENEEIISEIFNMTGYKVNRVEVPNLRSRTRFNYIQTMGANIIASFSQDFLIKIKSIFDNGVTVWHYNKTAFNMLDYSYENLERILL